MTMAFLFKDGSGIGGEGLFTAAMLALLAAALTFATNQIHEIMRRRLDQRSLARERAEQKRLRREALLIAFHGEIRTLENFVWTEAERARQCLKHDIPLEVRHFRVPSHVYQANTNSLGEIGDSRLVAGIVELYSIAENVSEEARVIVGASEQDKVRDYRYVDNLANCLGSAVHLHAWLRVATKEFESVPDQISRLDLELAHGEHLQTIDELQHLAKVMLAEIRREALAEE